MRDSMPTTNSEDHPPSKPRLSILHLLIWTATSAAMMAKLRSSLAILGDVGLPQIAYLAAMAMYQGLAVGSVLMWAARWWRGLRFPEEPGEWLLVAEGLRIVLFEIGHLCDELLSMDRRGTLIAVRVAIFAVGLAPAFLCRQGRPWRLFFSILALQFATALTATFPGRQATLAALSLAFSHGLNFILVVLLLIAIGIDLRQSQRRGWVHWVGVLSALAFYGYHVVLWIFYM